MGMVLANQLRHPAIITYRELSSPHPMSAVATAVPAGLLVAKGSKLKLAKKTGEVTVTHLVIAIDLGKTINPMGARAQMVGGIMMGYGAALMEEVLFNEKGIMKNPNYNQYKLPRLSNLPEKLTVKLVETPDETGPFGARCIAEHPSISIPPAIMNAIQDATGVDLFEIPVKPKELLSKLRGDHNGDN